MKILLQFDLQSATNVDLIHISSNQYAFLVFRERNLLCKSLVKTEQFTLTEKH